MSEPKCSASASSASRHLDRMGVAAEQPLRRLPDDDAREQEQERGFRERGNALDLAVPVMVLPVGRLARQAHREIGHHGRGKIEQRMRGLRQNRQRAGRDADDPLGDRQAAGGRDRGERNPFFGVLHGRIRARPVAGRGADVNAPARLSHRGSTAVIDLSSGATFRAERGASR
jgi:hypothetical protein